MLLNVETTNLLASQRLKHIYISQYLENTVVNALKNKSFFNSFFFVLSLLCVVHYIN